MALSLGPTSVGNVNADEDGVCSVTYDWVVEGEERN
jgi:hypothetical protein